jgi:hypothetical protein
VTTRTPPLDVMLAAGPDPGLADELRLCRLVGDEIVLERRFAEGSITRWIFSDIDAGSFRWRAVESDDDGRTWSRPGDVGPPRPGGIGIEAVARGAESGDAEP